MKGEQLVLSVQLRHSPGFGNFVPGPNGAALAALRTPLAADLLLFGPPGSGKTHLLLASAAARSSPYLPLRELRAYGSAALQGLEAPPQLCLDDLDAVVAERDWALALLRLIDARRAAAAATLFGSAAPAERLACALPDLRTRLAAAATLGLRPLADADRAALLRSAAQARGLELPEEVAGWMLRHLPRDAGSLLAALERLDRAALTAKRRLSLPFVQQQIAPVPPGARTTPGS